MAETFTYLEDPRILNVPTPVDRYVIPVIPLYTWFYTSQVVAWNFFHQQYILGFMTPKRLMKLRFRILSHMRRMGLEYLPTFGLNF